MIALILFFALIFPAYADAIEYFVGTGGNDTTNSCTAAQSSSTPKRNISTSTGGLSCIKSAGDTLTILAGDYDEVINTNQVGYIPVSGTSSTNRVTIQGAGGAVVRIRPLSGKSGTSVLQAQGRNWIAFKNLVADCNKIEDIGISGIAANNILVEDVEILNCVKSGINIQNNAHDGIIRRVHSHDNGTSGLDHGVYLQGDRWLIEYSRWINNFGYGIQIQESSGSAVDTIVRYNYMSNNRSGGFVVTNFATNTLVHNNISIGSTASSPCGCGYTVNNGNTRFYNNLAYGNARGFYVLAAGATSQYRNNISVSNSNNVDFASTFSACSFNAFSSVPTGCTSTVTIAPTFVAVGSNFAQAAGSSTINAGTNVGFACNGACDIGPFETFGYSGSATINGNNMDITLGMNLNVQVLPATGMTGWAVNNGRKVSSATRLTGTDSVVRLTFDGAACDKGDTWNFSYTPGNVTDEAKIGNLYNQRLNAIATTTVSAGSCTGGGTPPPTGGLHIAYELDDGTSGTTPTTAQDSTANNLDGTLTNGPIWVAGRHGSAVSFLNLTNDYIAIPYGNGINPSTQSLTACMGVLPHTGMAASPIKRFFGSSPGTNQRFHVSMVSGTFSMGIQGSNADQNTQFLFTDGIWRWVCVEMNSATDTATLIIDNVRGTGPQSVKAYTSYAFASNFGLGEQIAAIPGESPGVTIDRFNLYTGILTPQEHTDLYNAWEPSSPPSAGTFSQVAHQFYRVRTEGGALSKLPSSDSAVSTDINVVPNAVFGVTTQTDCTVADCESIGEKIWYSLNGGPETLVPDVCAADAICFYGNPQDSQVLAGAVTCCLTGALTANDGDTTHTASAIPVFDLAQNASITNRRVLRLNNAAVDSQYCLKEKNQNGNAFTNYTPSAGACLTVVNHGGGGF